MKFNLRLIPYMGMDAILVMLPGSNILDIFLSLPKGYV